MNQLYIVSLVIGVGLLSLSLIGASDLLDADSPGMDSHHTELNAFKVLSLRNIIYFLFGFGCVGTLLAYLSPETGKVLTFGLAAGTGAFLAFVVARLFGYISDNDSGEQTSERSLEGKVAVVTHTLSNDRVGKVQIIQGGKSQELLARPILIEGDMDTSPEGWKSVLVVEMRKGVAMVSPLPEEYLET